MISRVMLSLRKAADEQNNSWSLTVRNKTGPDLNFSRLRGGPDGKEDDVEGTV